MHTTLWLCSSKFCWFHDQLRRAISHTISRLKLDGLVVWGGRRWPWGASRQERRAKGMTWQLILGVSDADNIFFMRLVALFIAFLEYKELYGCTNRTWFFTYLTCTCIKRRLPGSGFLAQVPCIAMANMLWSLSLWLLLSIAISTEVDQWSLVRGILKIYAPIPAAWRRSQVLQV